VRTHCAHCGFDVPLSICGGCYQELAAEVRPLRELREAVLRILGGAACSCDPSVGHVCEECYLLGLARQAKRKEAKETER
jgi:hypothetical protein